MADTIEVWISSPALRGRGTMRSMVVGVVRMRAPQKTVAQARMLRRKLTAPEAML